MQIMEIKNRVSLLRHPIVVLWIIYSSYKHRYRLSGDGEYEGSVQNEVNDFVRRLCCAGTKFQDDIACVSSSMISDSCIRLPPFQKDPFT